MPIILPTGDEFTANLKVAEATVISIEKETKKKIEDTVTLYTKLYPQEFKASIDQLNKKRWVLEDSSFATIGKGDGLVQRQLFEIPETLFDMIINKLDLDELKQFKGQKGSRWFAKRFKEFRSANLV